MSRLSKHAQQEVHDDIFAENMAITKSPSKAMLAAEPTLSPQYAKVKAQRMLKRTDVQEKIQKKLENLQALSMKNIKNALTSDNEQLRTDNAWRVVEQLRGKPIARNLNVNANTSLEDVLFD